MGYKNGHLPDSALAHIPGGRLAVKPALAWNAMCAEARKRGLAVPMPDGPESSYRTYEQQVQLRRQWCAKGACGNAAVPGTSNHGLGIAVDCSHRNPRAHRTVVDLIGAKYGWGAKGSDAPWEEWHMRWQPVNVSRFLYPFLPLHPGKRGLERVSSGPAVYGLTKRLQACGYLKHRTSTYTITVMRAVRTFQNRHHLKDDGIVGQVTWLALKDRAAFCARFHRPEFNKPI